MGDLKIVQITTVFLTLLSCSVHGSFNHNFIDEISASSQRQLWLELGSHLKALGSPEFKITNDVTDWGGDKATKVFIGYGDNRFVEINFERDDNYNKIQSLEFNILNVKGKFKTSQFTSNVSGGGDVRSYALEGTLSSCKSCVLNATIRAEMNFIQGQQLEIQLSIENTPGAPNNGPYYIPSVVLKDLEKVDATLTITIPMQGSGYVPRGAKADFLLKLKGNISNHCLSNCAEKAGTYIWVTSAKVGSFERMSTWSRDKSDMFKFLVKMDSKDEIIYDGSSRSIPSKIDDTYVLDSTFGFVLPDAYYDGMIHRKDLLVVKFMHLDTGSEYMKIRAFLPSKDHFRVELELYGETPLALNFNTTDTSSEMYLDTDMSMWNRFRYRRQEYCPENSLDNGNKSTNISITPRLSDIMGIKLPLEHELNDCNKLKIWETAVWNNSITLKNNYYTQIYADAIFLLPSRYWLRNWYLEDKSYYRDLEGLLLRREKIQFTENGYVITNMFVDVIHGSGVVELVLIAQNSSDQSTFRVIGASNKMKFDVVMSVGNSNDIFTAKVIKGYYDDDEEQKEKVFDGKVFNNGIVTASKYLFQQIIPSYLESKSFTISNAAYQNTILLNIANALQTIARNNYMFDYRGEESYQDYSEY